MPELVGDFGKFALIDGQRIFEMPTDTMRQFFRAIAIKRTDVTLNQLGLYSFPMVDRFGKAKLSTLSVPKWLLQNRTNCKSWNPKGKMWLNTDEITTAAIEVNAEQCPDVVFGTCLEYVLGTGNDIRDITATEEGRALFNQMVENIFLGIGNSIFALIDTGKHPLIYSSATNGWYNQDNTTAEEWDDYIDQQTGIDVKGHLTIIDQLKSEGKAHFNTQITNDEVDGDKYIGQVTGPDGLLARNIKNGHANLKRVGRYRKANMPVAHLVTEGVFDKAVEEINAKWDKIPEYYQYAVDRGNGRLEPMDGVLRYNGQLIIYNDEWGMFDEQIGVTTHRCVTTVPRNMAVASDVDNLRQFQGAGLRINQRLAAPYKGQVYMDTNFKVGCSIADHTFMANASHVTTP